MGSPSHHVSEALRAVSAGADPEPSLRAYLRELRAMWAVDEAGLLALGADGMARVRAWDGALRTEVARLEARWLPDGRIDPLTLASLPLRRIVLWPAGSEAVVLLGRLDDGPLPAPVDEPLLSAVLLAESARASRRVLPVAAALCAAGDEAELWRGADAALARAFPSGEQRAVAVPGSAHALVAPADTPAEREALAGLAALAAVVLGRAGADALA